MVQVILEYFFSIPDRPDLGHGSGESYSPGFLHSGKNFQQAQQIENIHRVVRRAIHIGGRGPAHRASLPRGQDFKQIQ